MGGIGDPSTNKNKQQIRNAKFLILDEFSMISPWLLGILDIQLRKIRQDEDHVFGGLSILIFGDFLQIPPVKSIQNCTYTFLNCKSN